MTKGIQNAFGKKVLSCVLLYTIIILLIWILCWTPVIPAATPAQLIAVGACLGLLVLTLIILRVTSDNMKMGFFVVTITIITAIVLYASLDSVAALLFIFPLFLTLLYNSKKLMIYTDIAVFVGLLITAISIAIFKRSDQSFIDGMINVLGIFIPSSMQIFVVMIVANIVYVRTRDLVQSNESSSAQIRLREKVLDKIIIKTQGLAKAANLFDLHKCMKESLVEVMSAYSKNPDSIRFHMGMISNSFYFSLDNIENYEKVDIKDKTVKIHCNGFDYDLRIDEDNQEPVLMYDNYAIIKLFDDNKLNYFMLVEGDFDNTDHSLESSLKLLQESMENSVNNLLLGFTLQTSQKEMIYAIAQVSESRSHQTGAHIIRVSEYMRVLCREAGYTEEEAEKVSIASMLHDVGKLYISSEILDKNGKLTDYEYETIKQHVILGTQLISKCPGDVMEYARMMVREHHEKYDGTGYLKMKGEEISYPARLIAVADVFDALISKRSYKDGWDPQEAYNLIVSESGKHFDPGCVEVFKKCYLELIFIHRSNPDKF